MTEKLPVAPVDDCPATGGDNGLLPFAYFLQDLALQFPKMLLAVLSEDIGDGFSCKCDDLLVTVYEIPP